MAGEDPQSQPLVFTVKLGDTIITPKEIETWENRRINVVVAKLKKAIGQEQFESILTEKGLRIDSRFSIAERREALADLKIQLGREKMKQVYAWETYLSSLLVRTVRYLGRGKRKPISVEFKVDKGSAEYFVKWFQSAHERNDERAMLRANPDHHVIMKKDDFQDVIETTGGAPFATHFIIRFDDFTGVQIPRDNNYPFAFGGRCLLPDKKTEIGAAFHQFRDDPKGGWLAKLCIEFPVMMPDLVVRQHAFHLGCEFSNWANAAYANEVAK